MTEPSQNGQLVGSVLERHPSSSSVFTSNFNSTAAKTGFPAVQHRSKSAFARARDDLKKSTNVDRLPHAPEVIHNTGDDRCSPLHKPQKDPDDWRRQISEENEKRVGHMTDEEREQERREIFERFGGNVGDTLKRAKESRERKSNMSTENQQVPQTHREESGAHHGSGLKVKLHSQLSTPNTSRPSSRADRKLRFADVTPNDVHVYESAPPSPRKQPLALLPRSDSDPCTIPVISLGDYSTSLIPKAKAATGGNVEPDDGSPEYIRRRYFPTYPAFDPALAWIQSSGTNTDADVEPSPSPLRFDLAGKLIPPEFHSTLPTHLGLHHHANGEQAGYTLDDVLLLSRSTVPAQRSSMLGMLARISRQLSQNVKGDYEGGIIELKGREVAIRTRLLASGIEAMGERGSVGVMAIQVVWECLVRWDEEFNFIEGVELKQMDKSEQASPTEDLEESNSGDLISPLPFKQLIFPYVSDAFAFATLPRESLSQLLSILHRLAKHTNEIAQFIVSTPNLISNLFRTFILTPIPPDKSSPLPDPGALDLLYTLVSASRSNATALAEPADALLRFITPLPPYSPYPTPLAISLLTKTLRIYTTLASYGIHSHVATTASIQFSKLHQYVLSTNCESALRVAWFELMEAWIVCAVDPHKTTPSHEILWSQVSAWNWGPDTLGFAAHLTTEDTATWLALWRCISAWLEGAQVNGVSAGKLERNAVIEVTKPGFDHGIEKEVVTAVFKGLQKLLDDLANDDRPGINYANLGNLQLLGKYAGVLASSLRLWLACTPPSQHGTSLQSPPFSLPFPQLGDLAVKIVNHQIWTQAYSDHTPPYAYVFLRPLTLFLSFYLRLSRRLPTTSTDSWLAQVFVVLRRMTVGDEEFCRCTVEEVTEMINSDFIGSLRLATPSAMNAITNGEGIAVVVPFLLNVFSPKDEDIHVGPSCITPQSISNSTTQRLPPADLVRGKEYPLPLSRDWVFTPLDHLLRSGTSSVFKSLPTSWNGSEVGIVRATLLLVKVVREVLSQHGLHGWMLSMAETVFGCMKVFMLEHEQHNQDLVEVFRDSVVEELIEDLLRPFTISSSPTRSMPPGLIAEEESLEDVAPRFLGRATPVYQYYTDFVNLYDAISFGHPTFSQLLIVPTSTRYPVDFRKYLWGDYGHALRYVRTKPEETLTDAGPGRGLSEYLWPVECDPQVLGLYLRGLVRQGALAEGGVMRFIAVHHVASAIWKDLRCDADLDMVETKRDFDMKSGGKLLKAVVDQGGFDIIREVVRYRQAVKDQEGLLLAPECFESQIEPDRASQRLEFIGRVGGETLQERLRPLLTMHQII